MIVQVENAISENDCHRLIAVYDRCAHLTNVTDHTGHPVVYWEHMRDASEADDVVARLIQQCLNKLRAPLHPAGPLYPETVILAAMGPGGHHSRHGDNCRQNEQSDWVPNHTPQRDVSAIYYLNEEFEGGEISFEKENLVVKPRRGLLLAFPSDRDHVHEVYPVRSGIRYTMPIWFTQQESSAAASLSKKVAVVNLKGS
jgi:predicted 2-oxoglutarate/Fe(II)-dependent dioxygenase YbiX